MTEREDPLLDSLLDEVFAGQSPPNLTARILAARAAQAKSQLSSPVENPRFPLPLVKVGESDATRAADLVPPPIASASLPQVTLPDATTTIRRSGSRTTPPARGNANRLWTAAATLLVVGLGGGLTIWGLMSEPESRRSQTAQSENKKSSDGATTTAAPGENLAAKAGTHNQGDAKSLPVERPSAKPIAKVAIPLVPAVADGAPSPVGSDGRLVETLVVKTDEQVVGLINRGLRQLWAKEKLEPAPAATDAEWCRRAFLRLIGRIPTAEEVERFVASRSADKREQLVNDLLGGEQYASEFAGHWAETWARLLVGRTGGAGPDATTRREQLVAYLRRAIHDNKPFDELAYELIAATGSSQPGTSDYNGAVNFLLAHAQSNDKLAGATARVSRVFLGTQLQCAQCHTHPSEQQVAQDQFWQMNAFLRQMRVETDKESGVTRLVNRDFRGEGKRGEDAEIYYELGNGLVRSAYPVFIDGTELPHSGRVDEVDRRTELARLVRQSPNLSLAVMNRLWSHFLGYGFTNPVDDIGPHNPSVLPEVWNELAQSWSARRHDLRSAMRWIALSDAFGLSSKASSIQQADMPEAGGAPRFTRYYSRPMPIEELYRSLQLLADARREGKAVPGGELARRSWLNQLARRVGKDSVDDDQVLSDKLPATLIEMNDALPQQSIRGDQVSLLARVAKNDALSMEQKIEHLFQSALARKPNGRELEAAKKLLESSPADPAIGLHDLWWVLLNSNEFLLDH